MGETFDPLSAVHTLPWVEVCHPRGALTSPAALQRGPTCSCSTSCCCSRCAVAIYVACEWFVNAVEWLGGRLEVGPVAVGTILAAAGTALPESVVTLVAVLFGSHEHGNDIAVGAAMGGPLVVGTIAYGVTGGMLIWRKRRQRAALTAAASPRGARAGAPGGVGPDGRLRRPTPAAAARPRRGPGR